MTNSRFTIHLGRVSLGMACLGLVLAATLPAQTARDYRIRKANPPTLGTTFKLNYSGAAASKTLLVMISTSGGPTGLGFIGDPRSVDVGIELVSLWGFYTSGTGTGTLLFALPDVSLLYGQEIHAQTMTGPGTGSVVDKISDKVVLKLGKAVSYQKMAGGLLFSRALLSPVQTVKSTDPGGEKWLLPGGGAGTLLGASGLQTSEIFDSNTLSTVKGPNLVAARALNAVTPLGDGRALITGGITVVNGKSVVLATCEIYDPTKGKNGTFTATGSMATARGGHAATLLGDGRVLVTGGSKEFTDVLKLATSGLLRSSEVFDPKTGKWASAGNIEKAVLAPAMVTLSSGDALVCGGITVIKFFGIPIGIPAVKNCRRYDHKNSKWVSAASMKVARGGHTYNTVVLKDGRVLATGGLITSGSLTAISIDPIANAEYFTPSTGTWTSLTNLPNKTATHTVTPLSDGNALIIGGVSGTLTTPVSLKTVLRFNANNTYTKLTDLPQPLAGHATFVTHAGEVVLVGGQGSGTTSTLKDITIMHQ